MLSAAVLLGGQDSIQRPRDIWVFRSVLDKRARMVTLALSDDLWVAYDATNCGLYKAWKGGVKFDGAVYTTSHGPQPTSEGAAYVVGEVDKPVWSLTNGGRPVETKVRFRGYRMDAGQAILRYELSGGGKTVTVDEIPEFRVPSTFERRFSVGSLPEGWTARLALPAKESHLTGYEFRPVRNPRGRLEYSLDTARDPKLPNFVDLGQGVSLLNFRLAPLPSQHEELQAMVDESEQDRPPREPGVAVRVYDVGENMERLPFLVASQTPNVSFVAKNIDFKNFKDFRSPENQFLVHITGYINPPVVGKYRFRLTSDDGAVFWIRDTKIADNDGLNSGTAKEGEFEMNRDEQPFRIEYFENGGDEVLKLEWQRPGSSTWEVVPESAFTTFSGEVRVTSPGRKRVVQVGARNRPGDRIPLQNVHPSYTLTTIRPDDFKPRVGGIDFLPDGRMVVCTWDADGAVYVLDGVQGNGKVTVKRIAAGLAEPLGIKVVGKDIYVLQKQELTKLVDKDGDDVIDEYYALANGWGVTDNFHEFAFGLVHRNGKFYAALATAIDPGGASTRPQNPDRGKVIEIDGKTGDFKFIASGLRTPNGIGFGFKDGIYVTDNQGDWLPSSKLLHIKPGKFYGSYSVEPEMEGKLKEEPPVVWLPQGEIGNSPSQPAPLNDGPYKGQMVHGDVTHGGVKRVFVEEVGGVRQGAVFRFTQGLEAGVNRIHWGPDGALYIGGIGAAGNWGQEGKERFGLQRMKWNGKPAFEMLATRVRRDGFEIELTEPLAADQSLDPTYLTATQWRYVPTAAYGGPKVDEAILPVRSLTVSRDRKKIYARIDGLKENHVVHLRLDPTLLSEGGRDLWSTEAWYTLNRLPSSRLPAARDLSIRVEPDFVPLFDGKSTAGWAGWRQPNVPNGWRAQNGILEFVPGGQGGDIRTQETYANFDLRFEWKVGPGGNSGVFYRANESQRYPWFTGPEYQLLDNERHPDGRSPNTSAGSNYAVQPTDVFACRPAGQWNVSRILAEGNRVRHFLNGRVVADYTVGSAEWEALVKESKFATLSRYGRERDGYIVLQDHGDPVSFRNLRIKRL